MLSVLLVVGAVYVSDAACGDCHADVAKTYKSVAMSHAFYRPRADRDIEDFDAPPYVHEKSKQYFEMRRRGEKLVFRRWQLGADGKPVNVFEQQVDWIIGSGNHARTYIYRTPGGEMYMLPINWYSQTRQWRMSPGYDRPDHDGVLRRVRHECMFCHNAFPRQMPAEPLSYWRSQTFPADLPEGLGCQRCHGPGSEHVSAAKAKLDWKVIRASIVNPSRLPRQARNDVCYQCHMQPSVVLSGTRRFGRDIYSFRPGQLLSDYLARIDITEEDQPKQERFEINHHPYRLEQSKCFTESEGQLSCLTCHDPHRKVAEVDRPAHYRKACMSCHAAPHHQDRDCTTCHMPARRTQDVVHVVMTDHFIRRTPGGPELLAKREEREPLIASIEGQENELYRLIPLLRAVNDAKSVQRLEQLLAQAKPNEVEPYLDLAAGQLRHRRYAQLEQTAKTILAKDPKQPLAIEWLGLARAAQTRNADEAIRALEQVTNAESRPESEFNLGVLLAQRGRFEEAITRYRRALDARPNFVAAWIRLGEAQLETGAKDAAMESFRKALAIDPNSQRANEALKKLTSPSPPA